MIYDTEEMRNRFFVYASGLSLKRVEALTQDFYKK